MSLTHILKAGMLALAATIALSLALPAAAADHRGGGRGFFHSRGFHGPFIGNRFGHHFDPGRRFAGNGFRRSRSHFRDGYPGNGFRNSGFAWNDSRWGHNGRHFRPHRLWRLSNSPDILTRRGSGVTVILSNRADYDTVGTYAGSNDVFRVGGGTYVTGYGYFDERAEQTARLRPHAKIIDVTTQNDPCSHEGGVCVIRP